MFSRSKRFADDKSSCAPPPGHYDPKYNSRLPGPVTFTKSPREKRIKNVGPSVGQYDPKYPDCSMVKTPGLRTTQSSTSSLFTRAKSSAVNVQVTTTDKRKSQSTSDLQVVNKIDLNSSCEDLINLKCDRNSLLKQIEELESGRISQCVDLQRLKDENKELTDKIAAEKKQLLQDSEKNNNLVRELENKVNDHLQGNQRLMDENRELRNVIAENDSQLIQFYNEISTMKAQLKELHNIHAYANIMNNQLIHVKTLLKSAMEKSASYKSQYDDLTSKIEPFKEQLEMYYAERNTLISMENESELKVKELFDQYANLLTHQNNKQKIRHVVKLKEENLKCRAEVATLKKELARSKAAVASYQNKIDHLQGKRRFDPKLAFRHNKENDDPCGD